ncbi:opine dehydrogenase-like, partial [Littorina saxatilis]|uniref:opine dehydrogenase-like n=1 Tax=Littorina saxatilis TaxID=31220 RepID=UPI0038B4767E
LLYAKWRDWDGQPLSEKSLFYQGLDELGAASLCGVSDEVVATAEAISKQKPELALDWYRREHRLEHPMKKAGQGKWVPDFGYRYLTEDVPFGLVVTKGLAQLAGVPTPAKN